MVKLTLKQQRFADEYIRLGEITPVAPEKALDEKTVPELKAEAKQLGIDGYNDLKKDELVEAIAATQK